MILRLWGADRWPCWIPLYAAMRRKRRSSLLLRVWRRPAGRMAAAWLAALAVGGVHAMAHITGGGIVGNLNRVIPKGLSAQVQVDAIRLLPVFSYLRRVAKVCDEEMLATFNCGEGRRRCGMLEACKNNMTILGRGLVERPKVWRKPLQIRQGAFRASPAALTCPDRKPRCCRK